MSIKITWNNPEQVDSIKIYRSDSKIDLGNLPDVYATLPGTSEEYVDVMVSRNRVYHYVIAKTLGTGTVYSSNKPHGYYPDTGPGPQELKYGDWDSGYFGEVTTAELASHTQMQSLLSSEFGVGYSGGQQTGSFTYWWKFAYKGKILYYPNSHIGRLITRLSRTLYNAGLLFGVDDSCFNIRPDGASTTPVNQFRTTELAGYTFLVRSPRVFADVDLINRVTLAELNADDGGPWADERVLDGEYANTLGRMFRGQRIRNPYTAMGDVPLSSVNYFFSEHVTGDLSVVVNPTQPEHFTQLSTSLNNHHWVPVLELIA